MQELEGRPAKGKRSNENGKSEIPVMKRNKTTESEIRPP